MYAGSITPSLALALTTVARRRGKRIKGGVVNTSSLSHLGHVT